MIDEETLRKLNEMKLHAMSDALQKLLADSPGNHSPSPRRWP